MRFLFVSSILRGKYISVTSEGDEVVYDGIQLYLGDSEGETPQTAWEKLLSKHSLEDRLPDIKMHKIYAYETSGKEHEVAYMNKSQKGQKKEEVVLIPTNGPLEKIIEQARKLGITKEEIDKHKNKSLGLAKMGLGNLIKNFHK